MTVDSSLLTTVGAPLWQIIQESKKEQDLNTYII